MKKKDNSPWPFIKLVPSSGAYMMIVVMYRTGRQMTAWAVAYCQFKGPRKRGVWDRLQDSQS